MGVSREVPSAPAGSAPPTSPFSRGARRGEDLAIFRLGGFPRGALALGDAAVDAVQGGAVRRLLLLGDALAALDETREVQDLLVVRHGGGAEGEDALVEGLRRQTRLGHRVELGLEEADVLAAVRQELLAGDAAGTAVHVARRAHALATHVLLHVTVVVGREHRPTRRAAVARAIERTNDEREPKTRGGVREDARKYSDPLARDDRVREPPGRLSGARRAARLARVWSRPRGRRDKKTSPFKRPPARRGSIDGRKKANHSAIVAAGDCVPIRRGC